MSTAYNPSDRKDNCGFCSIARGLELQTRKVVDADQLFEETIAHLGLTRDGNKDPIPRMLVFPDMRLPSGVPPTAYAALTGALSLNSYTITQVASNFNLRFTYSKNAVLLPNQFLSYQAGKGGRGTFRDFVQVRLDFLESTTSKIPSADAVLRNVSDALVGDSIIGSEDVSHFINARIDPNGFITGYDPQDGSRYDASGLRNRIGSVALFMHLQ